MNRRWLGLVSLTLMAIFLLAADSKPPRPAYTPTKDYQKQTLQGFQLFIHPEALKHEMRLAEALKLLGEKLSALQKLLPKDRFDRLCKVPFWIEWQVRPQGAAEVHISAGWLKDHGYNPDKLNGVEINNINNFILWTTRDQPMMVLHELAHAYHHRYLGARHAGIDAAYRQAKERHLYDEVAYVHGGKKQKAYAMTNPDEYFAELTEAYWGKNDFFPFTRDELKQHDPIGYKLMETIWGK